MWPCRPTLIPPSCSPARFAAATFSESTYSQRGSRWLPWTSSASPSDRRSGRARSHVAVSSEIAPRVRLARVSVEVRWGRNRHVELVTLRPLGEADEQ